MARIGSPAGINMAAQANVCLLVPATEEAKEKDPRAGASLCVEVAHLACEFRRGSPCWARLGN